MEAEHAAIDPLIEAIDSGTEPVGELVDALATALTAHLKHEEDKTLPLLDATLTFEQLQRFGEVNAAGIGPDAPRVFPWILDGVSEEAVETMLAPLPEPVRAAFQNDWRPAYNALTIWPAP